MRLNQVFKTRMEKVADDSNQFFASNAALAGNLYRQGLINLARELGGKQVEMNGIPPRVVFPDHSYLNMVLPRVQIQVRP